jgi:hypothetical protein
MVKFERPKRTAVLPEKDEKTRRRERLEQQKKLLSQTRLSDYFEWRPLLKIALTVVALALVIGNWGAITGYLAGGLVATKGLVENQANAAVVANYLLVLLILATVGVEFLPFLSAGPTGQSSASRA